MSGTINDATTSPQAKALFGLNISISIIGVVMGALMLYLKNNLLKGVKRKSLDLGDTGAVTVSEVGDDHIELGASKSYVDNPLHAQEQPTVMSAAVTERGDASADNDSANQATNITTDSQREHERVIEENKNLKAENSELKKKQSELDEKQHAHEREREKERDASCES